jgi:hypothetical protein
MLVVSISCELLTNLVSLDSRNNIKVITKIDNIAGIIEENQQINAIRTEI